MTVVERYTLPLWGTTLHGRKIHRVDENVRPRPGVDPTARCGQGLDYVWMVKKLDRRQQGLLCRRCEGAS